MNGAINKLYSECPLSEVPLYILFVCVDLTALREEAEEGANMGFTGKQVRQSC